MSASERDGRFAGGEGAAPEDRVRDERRREFLVGVKRWSLAVVGLATAGAVLTPGEAHAWSNGSWVNSRSNWANGVGWSNHGGGGGWVNRGGGGGGWINGHGGGWVNGHGGGGAAGWANRSAGTAAGWVNNRYGGGVGVGWVNHH